MYKNGDIVFRMVKNPKIGVSDQSRNQSITEHLRDNNDAIPFRSTRLLLGIVGAVPFTWKKPHTPSLHPINATIIISVAIFMAVVHSTRIAVQRSITQILNENATQQEQILNTEMFVLCFLILDYPAAWSDVSKLKRGVGHWLGIMKLYYEITGNHVEPRNVRLEKSINMFILLVPPIVFEISKDANPEMKLIDELLIAFTFCTYATGLICHFWIGNYFALKCVARAINANLTEELNDGLLTIDKLYSYRKLWLKMRDLSDSMSSLNAPVVICMIIIFMASFISYELVILAQLENYLSLGAHLTLGITYFTLLAFMARASHNATEEIKRMYHSVLASESVGSLHQKTQRDVVNMYLIENMRPSNTTYGGFVIVNKALLTSIISTITTYIVVIFQVTQAGKRRMQWASIMNKTQPRSDK